MTSLTSQGVVSRTAKPKQKFDTEDSERPALDHHQLPPASYQVEKGILSLFLQYPREIHNLCKAQNVSGAYFRHPAHREIFERMQQMMSQDAKLDLITVTDDFERSGDLEKVGGPAFLTELLHVSVVMGHAESYLERLREAYARFERIKIGEEMRQESALGEREADILHRWSEKIRALEKIHLPAPRIECKSLIDLARSAPKPSSILLGDRYLCVGGGLVFVGPSGIGKSSASAQQDILWALGRPAFGIKPRRPLKLLTIQAENDEGDLGEMARGICAGLGITESEQSSVRNNVYYAHVSDCTGSEFLNRIDGLLSQHRPDIFRIDPLLAYIGADVNNAREAALFLREGLNPLLQRYNCGVIINHHTPKVNNRDTSNYRPSDWMYGAAGSAEITNWARAMLVIDPTHAPGVFKFHAAKRGNRIGWDSESSLRYFCHTEGQICWRDGTNEDIFKAKEAAASAKKRTAPLGTAEDFLRLVPEEGSISKNELIDRAQSKGFGRDRARVLLKELVAAGKVRQHQQRRSGTNAEQRISREAQTADCLLA